MAEITIKSVEEEKDWEAFLAKHEEANFLQSWYWGEFHKALNKTIVRTGFYKGGNLIGVMLSIVEDARRGRYITVPAGPIIDWENNNLVEKFISEIKYIAKLNKCVFVRVRPQLLANDFAKNLFKKYGFVDAPMHLHAELTTQLDITKSTDEIIAKMRKATRYEIKKAEKLGIQVDKTSDPKAIKTFYDLEIETSKRQGFVPFSFQFLNEQFKVFAKAGKALLYTAKYKGDILAQAFVIFYGQEAAYHYGASTLNGRRFPGAYLIQWNAIKDARDRGIKRYNFWGVAPLEQTGHRFYGVSVFKRGFGGEDVEYLHAKDLVINKPGYVINFLIENVRKRIRKV
jgi:lipid II:glycine glycyltransferase (peptidoglycan interpeptide bridge formation enzyme)